MPSTPGTPFAQIHSKGKRKWVSFDKSGLLYAAYGYCFGEQLWTLKIVCSSSSHDGSLEQPGSIVVGVLNRRFNAQKLFGSIVSIGPIQPETIIRVYLDSNRKRMTIYTPANPNGEYFGELPKDGIYYPAV